MPRYTEDQISQAVAAYNDGATWDEAAAVIGIGRWQLGNRVREGGYETRPGRTRQRQSIVIPEDVATLAYVAGLFDGEGCVSHTRMGDLAYPIVQVAMTDEPVIRWLQELFPGSFRIEPREHSRRKTCYRWSLSSLSASADVSAFLVALLPFLRVKADVARAAIEEIRETASRSERRPGLPLERAA